MNSSSIHPYLFFNGNCEEALEFYKTALDAQVDMVMRYRDSPDSPPPGMIPEGYEDKIMHASFLVGGAMVMASDGCGDTPSFAGFSLHLGVTTEDEANRFFHALAEGGQVTMPLNKTFWSPLFGMVQDKFGMGWMISVEAAL
jgi:PhnB protein